MTDSVKDYKIRKLNTKIFIKFLTVIYYRARRYICRNCGKTFVENNPFGKKRQRIPNATVLLILEKLKPYTSTFASVGRELGISTTAVVEIFDKHVQIERKQLTSILCWDEFYFNRHSKYKYAFMIMDFKKKYIIDIVESRQYDILSDYFDKISPAERNQVQCIITDLYENYRKLAHYYFPKAILCSDPFHVTKIVTGNFNTLRKKVMNRYKDNKESLEYKLLKYRCKLLLMPRRELEVEERHYDRILCFHTTERDIVDYILKIDERLKKAYYLKEEYLRFNSTDESEFIDFKTKETELLSYISKLYESNIPECVKTASTLINWKKEIINSFRWYDHRRLSNGPIEGKNNYIKKIIGNANGMNNFKRARNKFIYSQNLLERFSHSEIKKPIKRDGAKRGHYKKKQTKSD